MTKPSKETYVIELYSDMRVVTKLSKDGGKWLTLAQRFEDGKWRDVEEIAKSPIRREAILNSILFAAKLLVNVEGMGRKISASARK